MTALANTRHEAFCFEYIKDRNATAAYKRAGYAPKSDNSAKSAGSRLLTNVKVRARIAAFEAEYSERVQSETLDMLRSLVAIVRADPSRICRPVRGACRYCHGAGYHYQWRTLREFDAAVYAWKGLPTDVRAMELEPSNAGGFGYNATRAPHPDCPECDGLGLLRVHFTAYDDIPEGSRPLYRGVEVTKSGAVKVVMEDQAAALDKLARHLGFYDKKRRGLSEAPDAMTKLIMEINRTASKAPITSSLRQVGRPDAIPPKSGARDRCENVYRLPDK